MCPSSETDALAPASDGERVKEIRVRLQRYRASLDADAETAFEENAAPDINWLLAEHAALVATVALRDATIDELRRNHENLRGLHDRLIRDGIEEHDKQDVRIGALEAEYSDLYRQFIDHSRKSEAKDARIEALTREVTKCARCKAPLPPLPGYCDACLGHRLSELIQKLGDSHSALTALYHESRVALSASAEPSVATDIAAAYYGAPASPNALTEASAACEATGRAVSAAEPQPEESTKNRISFEDCSCERGYVGRQGDKCARCDWWDQLRAALPAGDAPR